MNQFHTCKSIQIMAIVACLLAASCGGNGQKSRQAKEAAKTFTLPSIPMFMTDPEERANYLVAHYWDRFDFSDTTFIDLEIPTEQAFVNYLEILPHAAEQTVRLSIRNTIERALATPQMYGYFTGLFAKYLDDPNSRMRHEELYIAVLESIVASPKVNEWDKVQPQFRLEQAYKNRPGTLATDFVYTLANGKRESMYKIKAEYLILFFNNPGCGACGEYQYGLEQSPVVTQLMASGRVKILAMYVDQDIEAWDKHQHDMPAHWINGYDASCTIRNQNLYDLRAIPNLYLLDKDKRVVLKDAVPYQLEELLLSYVQQPK